MREAIYLKLLACDNGLTINVSDSSGQTTKLQPIWYENNPGLDVEILLKEIPFSQSTAPDCNIHITGWNTTMTKGHFHFYLVQRIFDENGSIIADNIINRFLTYCVNTSKVDTCDVFQNVFVLFSFEYKHKFWDKKTYDYRLSVFHVKEDFNILYNHPDQDFLHTAVMISMNKIPGVTRLGRKDNPPPYQVALNPQLSSGRNKVLLTCNQYGDSSGGISTNVGLGKTWFVLSRYDDSLLYNIQYFAVTTAPFLIFEFYVNN